jgi:hypothetical protein
MANHLTCISNDPSFELDPTLSRTINYESFEPMVRASKEAGETFNAGYENHTIAHLATIVETVVEREMPEKAPIRIETTSTNDPRSYHVSSKRSRQSWASGSDFARTAAVGRRDCRPTTAGGGVVYRASTRVCSCSG